MGVNNKIFFGDRNTEGINDDIGTQTPIDDLVFELLPNGKTIRYNGVTPGETGLAANDNSGKIYTAYDQTMWDNIVDINSVDFTTVCTTLVTNMQNAFEGVFSQNISHFDTSNVTNMSLMFRNSSFNGDVSCWDVSSVTNFTSMFRYTTATPAFNQPLNDWDVSSGEGFESMFSGNTLFNQPLNNWNTGSATNMIRMFVGASSFNQDLSSWCVENIPSEPTDFDTGATAWVLPKPNWGVAC